MGDDDLVLPRDGGDRAGGQSDVLPLHVGLERFSTPQQSVSAQRDHDAPRRIGMSLGRGRRHSCSGSTAPAAPLAARLARGTGSPGRRLARLGESPRPVWPEARATAVPGSVCEGVR
jgi:hypothetical protein